MDHHQAPTGFSSTTEDEDRRWAAWKARGAADEVLWRRRGGRTVGVLSAVVLGVAIWWMAS